MPKKTRQINNNSNDAFQINVWVVEIEPILDDTFRNSIHILDEMARNASLYQWMTEFTMKPCSNRLHRNWICTSFPNGGASFGKTYSDAIYGPVLLPLRGKLFFRKLRRCRKISVLMLWASDQVTKSYLKSKANYLRWKLWKVFKRISKTATVANSAETKTW